LIWTCVRPSVMLWGMKPYMIIIDGPMGSGKTTVASLLNTKLKRTAHLSMDRIKFFVSDFRRGEEDNSMTTAVLMKMISEYIRQGINLLIAQGFWKKEYMEPYIKIAKKNNLNLFVYQLEAPRTTLLERINERSKPKEAKTQVSKDRILKNLKMWEENKFASEKAFDTSKVSAEEIIKTILKDIKNSDQS